MSQVEAMNHCNGINESYIYQQHFLFSGLHSLTHAGKKYLLWALRVTLCSNKTATSAPACSCERVVSS